MLSSCLKNLVSQFEITPKALADLRRGRWLTYAEGVGLTYAEGVG